MKINIKDFLKELEEQEIIYCSWKNNHLLDEVLNCKKDLDLYIPLGQKAEFLSILHKNKFIEGESSLSSYPYIHHFYTPGEDGRLFHLHVYFRILTGESHLKDYWLPLENLLEKRRKKIKDILYVADDETQRLIYILRHYLKKSSTIGLLMHWRERADYSEELKNINCKEISADTADIIDRDLVSILDSSLETASTLKTWWLGIRLRHKILSLKRTSAFKALLYRYGNMVLRIVNKLTFKHKKMLVGGGRFIAITGLDGSGKTSIIKSITSVLSKDFSVRKIHIGRPPATLMTFPARLALTLRKKVITKNSVKIEEKQIQTVKQQKINLISALRYAILAYERNHLAKKAYQYASQGGIVISDRFPSTTHGKMDSPRIIENDYSPAIRWLSKIEQHYYKMMPQPDLLLELYVPVEVAIRRNQGRQKEDKETDEEIRERYEENSNLRYKTLNHFKVNNDQPFEVASSKILDTVWSNLL